MSTKLLTCVKEVITGPLTIIINQTLETGIFPHNLKTAMVIPLLEKENDSVFTNYQPISLLPVISKVIETHV